MLSNSEPHIPQGGKYRLLCALLLKIPHTEPAKCFSSGWNSSSHVWGSMYTSCLRFSNTSLNVSRPGASDHPRQHVHVAGQDHQAADPRHHRGAHAPGQGQAEGLFPAGAAIRGPQDMGRPLLRNITCWFIYRHQVALLLHLLVAPINKSDTEWIDLKIVFWEWL